MMLPIVKVRLVEAGPRWLAGCECKFCMEDIASNQMWVAIMCVIALPHHYCKVQQQHSRHSSYKAKQALCFLMGRKEREPGGEGGRGDPNMQ